MTDRIATGLRSWLIGLFASAVIRTTSADDRVAAIRWLGASREVVASDATARHKLRQLSALVSTRSAASAVARSVGESVKNYRQSRLPWAVKIALPATLAALPLVGAQGAGVAAFGGAVGVPLLLLVFLGTAGITAIIEAIVTSPDAQTEIAEIIDVIIADERLRRASAEMKAAMRAQPISPTAQPMPSDDAARRAHLYAMDPFAFEQHVMSFFIRAGLEAWVTQRSNDMGVDGFAVHEDGLVIVQCKRYAASNKVGRPAVQQFKGVVEEQNALRGYIVTTSDFTDEAKASAAMSDKLVLCGMDMLVAWHEESAAAF